MKGESEVLSKKAYNFLLGQLLKNKLVPGDAINRRDVANSLGMSVAPVLEAMLQLTSEDYLESVPRKGTIVKPIRIEDVKGQLIVREALECAAARYYHGRLVKDNYDVLAEIAHRLDEFNDDSFPRWQAEIEFHQGLVRLTDIKQLIREFERNFRLNIFYRINRARTSPGRRVINRHRKLLDELVNEDQEAVEKAVRDHIRAGKEDLFIWQ